MAKPRAGDWLDDEMHALADLGVSVAVCLLTDEELRELDLGGERLVAESAGLTFLRLPIADRGLPDRAASASLVRSPVVAVAVLIAEGLDPDGAWRLIGDARVRSVPDTAAQRSFVDAGHR